MPHQRRWGKTEDPKEGRSVGESEGDTICLIASEVPASVPIVTSQPGRTLAARTGAMQHIPMGFLASLNDRMTSSTSLCTLTFGPSLAKEQRVLAAPYLFKIQN